MTADHLKQELYGLVYLVAGRKLRQSYFGKFGKPFYLFCEAIFNHLLYMDHTYLSVQAPYFLYFSLRLYFQYAHIKVLENKDYI